MLCRVVAVVFPTRQRLFCRRNVTIMALLVFPVAAALTVVADVVLPCCTLGLFYLQSWIKSVFSTYYYYGTFSYKFFGDGVNYKNLFMDIPLNTCASALSICCYGSVCCHAFKCQVVPCTYRSSLSSIAPIAASTSAPTPPSTTSAGRARFATPYSLVSSRSSSLVLYISRV